MNLQVIQIHKEVSRFFLSLHFHHCEVGQQGVLSSHTHCTELQLEDPYSMHIQMWLLVRYDKTKKM